MREKVGFKMIVEKLLAVQKSCPLSRQIWFREWKALRILILSFDWGFLRASLMCNWVHGKICKALLKDERLLLSCFATSCSNITSEILYFPRYIENKSKFRMLGNSRLLALLGCFSIAFSFGTFQSKNAHLIFHFSEKKIRIFFYEKKKVRSKSA